MKTAINRIEFWILIFFLIRLVGLTNPPLETGHNWRQVTGLMVARNYLEVDPNILYPRVDETNGKSGIIGMEFPAMNYVYFMVAKVFGYTHWYGRLLNLLVSSIGLLFFGKILMRYFNHRIALASVIFLAGSIWFAFSRKMMPDTFCISLMFIGIYYGSNYLLKPGALSLILYVLFTSLAVLTKIPAGIYFIVIFLIALNSSAKLREKVYLASATGIPLLLAYLWYFVWNPHLSEEFGNWYNVGKPIAVGFTEVISNLDKTLENFYFNSFHSYLIFFYFVAGLILIIYKRNYNLLWVFASVFIVFLIYIFKSGFYFYHHNYYIIPFVPVMALVAGYAISFIPKKGLFALAIVLGITESVINQQHDFFIKGSEKYKMELESIADSVSARHDLIVINGNGNAQQLYLSHRKGWNCSDNQLTDTAYINNITQNGCKFIFINKHGFQTVMDKPVVFENENYRVYETGFSTDTIRPFRSGTQR
ncbi:MAG: glycosyltransferase family 39 protein [Bacteroidia bacterium]